MIIFSLESVTATAATLPTRHVHLISLDPLDENYFASAGPASENVLSVWDKRRLPSNNYSTAAVPSSTPAVLEVQSVLPHSFHPGIWSLRYSGYRRGAFAVLSAGGLVRLFETSQSQAQEAVGGPLFVKHSHNLNASSAHQSPNPITRAIAFDHACPGGLRSRDSVLTITQNHQLQVLDVPSTPAVVEISALGEVAFVGGPVATTCASNNLQCHGTPPLQDSDEKTNERTQMTGRLAGLSSRERHERFQNARLNASDPSLVDALKTIDLQRQRCLRGYLFDCQKNMDIVKDDPWLVELWETIRRLNQMASNRGMMHGGLDLSFFGVHDIWFADFEELSHRRKRSAPSQEEFSRLVKQILASHSYGDFVGVETEYPERRQLALAICGWKFDERRLREKCSDIISRKEYYKAIVVAVAHGRKDIAIDLLKSLTRTKALDNSGLAAVIACSTISEEQRSLCDWMADEAEDPYLKALLAYFVSGTWRSVVDMTELPLQYRVAIALKYLPDDLLGQFLAHSLEDVVRAGDTEGIVLTGLTEPAMELLQNYTTKFHDLQTTVLALSFTAPVLSSSIRWELWKTSYFDQMQAWSAFVERARFINQYNKIIETYRAVAQAGIAIPPSTGKNMLLQCTHCQKPITRQQEADGTYLKSEKAMMAQKKSELKAEGTVCQRCGQHFSRCAICLHWQGYARGRKPLPSDSATDNCPMAALIGFCIRCKHSFHVAHAKEWFAQHERCPVPECSCNCNMGQGLARR